jgi:hypothetical protein
MNYLKVTDEQRAKDIRKRIDSFKTRNKGYKGAWVKDMFIIKTHSLDWFGAFGDCYDLGYIVGYEKAKREMRNKK